MFKYGNNVHIFRQSRTEGIHSGALGCSWTVTQMKEESLRERITPRPPFSAQFLKVREIVRRTGFPSFSSSTIQQTLLMKHTGGLTLMACLHRRNASLIFQSTSPASDRTDTFQHQGLLLVWTSYPKSQKLCDVCGCLIPV